MAEQKKKACGHDFIMSLSNGYDTKLEDGGTNTSGGEKQRISSKIAASTPASSRKGNRSQAGRSNAKIRRYVTDC